MFHRVAQTVIACVLAFAAAPALAGLEFADNFTVGAGTGFTGVGTNQVTYEFSGTTYSGAGLNALNGGTGVGLPGTFHVGPDIVTVSATGGTSTTDFLTTSLDFSYTGNPNDTASYGPAAGTPPYNLVIQLGNITVAPGAALQLASVAFGEEGVFPTDSVWTVAQSLTSLDSGTVLFLFIDPAQVPLVNRNVVDVVRLNFIFTGGAGTSFAVNAVANPEPGTFALFGLGIAGLGLTVLRRRRRKLVAASTTDAV